MNRLTIVLDIDDAFNVMIPCLTTQADITEDLEEFSDTFTTSKNPALWLDLIAEETFEFMEELHNNGVTPNLIKEYSDILYVIEGFMQVTLNRSTVVMGDGTTKNAIDTRIEQICDRLHDIAYIAHIFFTIDDIAEAFSLVHASNMSKLTADGKVLRREDGKVLKSELYVPADMEDVVDPDWLDGELYFAGKD